MAIPDGNTTSKTGRSQPQTDAPPAQPRSSITRSVLTNWLWYFLVMASGFVLPRLIHEHQGKALLGIWDLGWSLVFYLNLLSLGVGSAVNRHVARYRAVGDWDGLNATTNSCLLILLGSFLLALGGAAVFVALVSKLLPGADAAGITTARWIVAVLAVSASLQLPASVFNGVITGCERFDALNLIRGTGDGLVFLVSIILLVSGGGIVALAITVLVGELVSDAARLIVARRICPELRISLRLARRPVIKEMMSFGGRTMVQGMARGGLYQASNILVVYFLGPMTLAVYTRQRALVLHATRFLRQYSQVLIPTSSRIHASGDVAALRDLLISTTRYGFYATLPIVALLLLMGGPLLELWMGVDYRAPTVLAILAVGHVLVMPQQVVYSILMGMGKHGLPAVFEVIGLVCGLGIAALGLGVFGWGMAGAAIGVSVAVTLATGILSPAYACRLLQISPWTYARAVIPVPLVATIPFAGCLLLGRLLWPDSALTALLVGVGSGACVMTPIYWRLVLPNSIRKRVRSLLGLRSGDALMAAARGPGNPS